MKKHLPLIVLLILILGSVLAWKGRQEPLPTYTTHRLEKVRGKWREAEVASSKQPAYPVQGSNLVVVPSGDNGSFYIEAVSDSHKLYIEKQP